MPRSDTSAPRPELPRVAPPGDRHVDVPRVDTRVDLDQLPDPVFALDHAGCLRLANRRAAELFGWDLDDLIGRPVLDLVHPDDLNLALSAMETIGGKDVGEVILVRARTADGDWVRLEIRGAAHPLGDGGFLNVIVARDTTDRHQLHLDRGEDETLRTVMANMHTMVILLDPDGRVRSINGAVTRVLALDPERVPGSRFVDIVHPDDRDQVGALIDATKPFDSVGLDARFVTDAGEEIICEFTVLDLSEDPALGGYIVSGHVATALADARNRVDFVARHDSRTGLLNRDGFRSAAHELIAQGGGLGLMIIDIVQFRSINELYGERVGDGILTAVAERLDDIRWPGLIRARYGGDEFVLAVRSASRDSIEMLRDRVRRDLSSALDVDGQEINVAIRTATAYDSRPQGLETLMTTASNELMSVKRNAEPETGGISFDVINQRRRQLEQLRAAIGSGEIQPFFQPIVGSDGRVLAVEALVRWVHPLRGVLGAGEILPLAQMAGLAEAIDERVLDQALAFAHRLASTGHGDVEVHVNVDPKVIARTAFATRFLRRCASHGADPRQIVVEITETDLLAPGVTSLENMEELRRAGIRVAIDDFGTGYSSLAHLLELPIDSVKIDRRFVAGIDVDPAATNLTTAILGLTESLQLACVAEGVEQPYQLDRLVALGCRAFQGWLFAAAVSADELIDLLPVIAQSAPTPTGSPEPAAAAASSS